MVTSLNGDSEPGVFVEAVGSGSCSSLQEESKTEQDGSFRIRGLQVGCVWEESQYDVDLVSWSNFSYTCHPKVDYIVTVLLYQTLFYHRELTIPNNFLELFSW